MIRIIVCRSVRGESIYRSYRYVRYYVYFSYNEPYNMLRFRRILRLRDPPSCLCMMTARLLRYRAAGMLCAERHESESRYSERGGSLVPRFLCSPRILYTSIGVRGVQSVDVVDPRPSQETVENSGELSNVIRQLFTFRPITFARLTRSVLQAARRTKQQPRYK